MVIAGGSGGHILPAVSLCAGLDDPGEKLDVVFVTAKSRGLEKLLPGHVKVCSFAAQRSILGILELCSKAVALLFREKPGIIIGFGGYLSVPFVFFGRCLGARVIIHEQNVRPGRANRFLAPFAHKIVISFAGSAVFFGKNNRKVFLAPYPLRKGLAPVERSKALARLGLKEGYFTVLVVGGSQGSRRLNDIFISALKMSSKRPHIQIIHLCGRDDLDEVGRAHQEMRTEAKVFAFLPEIEYAYSSADLVIARSGAGSVHEIIRFGLPSILVPYPHAGAHQVDNARVLAEKGAAVLIEEKMLKAETLSGLLDIFIDDTIRRKTMSRLARSLEDSSGRSSLADIVLAEAKR